MKSHQKERRIQSGGRTDATPCGASGEVEKINSQEGATYICTMEMQASKELMCH